MKEHCQLALLWWVRIRIINQDPWNSPKTTVLSDFLCSISRSWRRRRRVVFIILYKIPRVFLCQIQVILYSPTISTTENNLNISCGIQPFVLLVYQRDISTMFENSNGEFGNTNGTANSRGSIDKTSWRDGTGIVDERRSWWPGRCMSFLLVSFLTF